MPKYFMLNRKIVGAIACNIDILGLKIRN